MEYINFKFRLGGLPLGKINIFLSYCWQDNKIASSIYEYFKNNKSITLHMDQFDIKKWNSIKKYMQSIIKMDYTILLISDSYLKSSNCMYEVLEVMKDINYNDKIFPAIINNEIYNQFNKLNETLKGIQVQNIGNLNEDLKRYQDISSNIAEFLDVISDMNNPNINDVSKRIEEKLNLKGLINNNVTTVNKEENLFKRLNIKSKKLDVEPNDLEVNQFVKNGFNYIIEILSQLCEQYQIENAEFQFDIDKIDSKTVLFTFYKSGKFIKGLKIFLSSIFGGRENIGISEDSMSSFVSNNNSWNGMYDAKFVDGTLKFYSSLSIWGGQKAMSEEEVVKDIWENHIENYLKSR